MTDCAANRRRRASKRLQENIAALPPPAGSEVRLKVPLMSDDSRALLLLLLPARIEKNRDACAAIVISVVVRTSERVSANVPGCDTATEAPWRFAAAAVFRPTNGRTDGRRGEEPLLRSRVRDSRSVDQSVRWPVRKRPIPVHRQRECDRTCAARTPADAATADRNVYAPQHGGWDGGRANR